MFKKYISTKIIPVAVVETEEEIRSRFVKRIFACNRAYNENGIFL